MSRVKTFFIYALCLVLFFIFSEVMIHLNLEATYKNIGRKDRIEQITIYQAEATKINGRIKGKIYNDSNNNIKNSYLEINFYSERDNFLGRKYIDISNMRENETRNLEVYFKVQDVKYYELKFVNEKQGGEIEDIFKDLKDSEIKWGVFLTFLIFW